jgi:hypothetical protein
MNPSPSRGSVTALKTPAAIEATLRRIAGTQEVGIEIAADGTITQISITADDNVQPKAMVRNVEAALKANFDLRVDHKRISIALMARPPLPPAFDGTARAPHLASDAQPPSSRVAVSVPSAPSLTSPSDMSQSTAAPPARPYTLESVNIDHGRSAAKGVRVVLVRGTDTFTGSATATQAPMELEHLAALAALDALAQIEGRELALRLEGAKLQTAFDRPCVVVSVATPQSGTQSPLMGIARVIDRVEVAAVLAVLDATNRWLAARAAGLAEPRR